MTAAATKVLPVPVAISKRKRSFPSFTADWRARTALSWYSRRNRSLLILSYSGRSASFSHPASAP